MHSRLGTSFLAAMGLVAVFAGPAEAPAAPVLVQTVATKPQALGLDLRRNAGARLLPAGGHWATGLALAFRQ